jgi:hypothetical protein
LKKKFNISFSNLAKGSFFANFCQNLPKNWKNNFFFFEEVVMKAIRISEYMPEKDLEKVLN